MKKEKEVNAVNKKGFTLMELLTVVVIIGLLTSIALPIYRKAVEKSKASDALTAMQAVAKSEHELYLVKNKYTKDFTDLDIDLKGEIENSKLKTAYYNYELLDNGILATRTNKEYSLYKDYELQQIMCSPSEHYICDSFGKLTKEPCQKIGMAWANSNSTCYATPEARCKDLHGNSMWHEDTANSANSYCGYDKTQGQELNEGVICIGDLINFKTFGCQNSIINDGGKCLGTGIRGCNGSVINSGGVCSNDAYFSNIAEGTCHNVTINGGGICIGDNRGCRNAIINEGGICEGNTENACSASTINGGICEGKASYTCRWSNINSGGICKGADKEACREVTINSGGICEGNSNDYDHKFYRSGCWKSTINSGGICKGKGQYNCASATVKEGGECWAEAVNACASSPYGATTYEGTGATSGCCRGKYCPSGTPRCECTNHETACDAAPTL